jgi:hypothetical protein
LFAENRSGLRLSLRSLWGAYEHVLSSQGGMGKSFLSGGDGEYGPGVLDLVLFSVLLVLRPTARKLVPQEPDILSTVPSLKEWYGRLSGRSSVRTVCGTSS